MLPHKKLLVFGTGSVGGYYGGVLVKAGFDVTFISRGKTYEALKKKGLTLIIEGKKENIPIHVVRSIHELPQQGYDYIFLSVKSMNTKEAAQAIKNLNFSAIVSLQNGLGNEEILANVLGKDKVIGGLVFVAASTVEPGVVNQFGYNGGMIGEMDGKITERILEIQKIFVQAVIDMKVSDNIEGEIWNKLVWNTAFNPLSVITKKTLDKMLIEDFELVKSIMSEVKDVAIAHDIKIRQDTVEFNLERSKGFTGFKTSMLQDYEKGKLLEIDAILGVVIRKAQEKNIRIPNIEKIYDEIKTKV